MWAAAGLVPSPGTVAGNVKYLCENGTWSIPSISPAIYNSSMLVFNKILTINCTFTDIYHSVCDHIADLSVKIKFKSNQSIGATIEIAHLIYVPSVTPLFCVLICIDDNKIVGYCYIDSEGKIFTVLSATANTTKTYAFSISYIRG